MVRKEAGSALRRGRPRRRGGGEKKGKEGRSRKRLTPNPALGDGNPRHGREEEIAEEEMDKIIFVAASRKQKLASPTEHDDLFYDLKYLVHGKNGPFAQRSFALPLCEVNL